MGGVSGLGHASATVQKVSNQFVFSISDLSIRRATFSFDNVSWDDIWHHAHVQGPTVGPTKCSPAGA